MWNCSSASHTGMNVRIDSVLITLNKIFLIFICIVFIWDYFSVLHLNISETIFNHNISPLQSKGIIS